MVPLCVYHWARNLLLYLAIIRCLQNIWSYSYSMPLCTLLRNQTPSLCRLPYFMASTILYCIGDCSEHSSVGLLHIVMSSDSLLVRRQQSYGTEVWWQIKDFQFLMICFIDWYRIWSILVRSLRKVLLVLLEVLERYFWAFGTNLTSSKYLSRWPHGVSD